MLFLSSPDLLAFSYKKYFLMPRERLLTFEEIGRVVGVFASMGVTRFRLTGGEPTVRRGLEDLVARIAGTPGVEDVAMTTNGHLFAARAEAFAKAGLGRINVSIDTLDPEAFLPREEYERQIGELVEYLHATATRPGDPPVIIPGEFEETHRRKREAQGIPIEEPVWNQIQEAVAELQVNLPAPGPA